MNYRIAIPSYKREKTIKDKTLSYLKDCGMENEIIDIFVADDEEYKAYSYLKEEGYNLIVGQKGIRNQREFIVNYYNEGDMILSIDDDIEYLSILEGKELIKYMNIDKIITSGFKICKMNKTILWGVSAVNNAFYMDKNISTNLKFIVGCFYGFIVDKDKNLKTSVESESKEDYEKTIKVYKKYGKIIRFNYICPNTTYYSGDGGLNQEGYEKRLMASEKAALYLLKEYPEYVSLKGKSSKGFLEIRLKSKV